jgi:hypothetical protein
MGGASSRRKGHSWEREIAEFLNSCGFSGVKRHLEFQGQEALGYDLDNTEPFVIQAKNHKRPFSPLAAFDEIKHPGYRMAFIKQTNRGWYVALAPETAEYIFKMISPLLPPRKRRSEYPSEPSHDDPEAPAS